MQRPPGALRGILAALLLVFAFGAGWYFGLSDANGEQFLGGIGVTNASPPEGVDLTPFFEAWSVLSERFVPATTTEQVSPEDRIWGAIQGLADSYDDPYTVFLPPVESEQFEADISGNFEGVGMEIGMRDDVLTVIAPLKGSPAEGAGIRSGDQILRIDGDPTDTLSIDEAVTKIRGEGGTAVVFTIARDGSDEILEVSVIRDVIQIPTVDTRLTEEGVFIIELHNFNALSMNLFRGALREFVESGSGMLLVDLRGNPGGFLEAAVDITSWFLPLGKVIVTEDFGDMAEARVHRSKGYNIFNDNLKFAVLVDNGSASASEIFAGALQDYGEAFIIGTQTFGKGSVQELVPITADTSLKVTIARWTTPNGRSISGGGITPDLEVPVTLEELEVGEDPQLKAAIEHLLGE